MSYSATQLAKKLDISRSYLYYLKDNGVVEVEINDNGRVIWNEEAYQKLSEYIKKNKADSSDEPKDAPKEYKTTKINNRRYLGNKYKLLPFITRVVENECKNINTVADIFAGTGAVASAFIDKKIITNDIMYSNYICHVAWFSSEHYSEEKVIKIITQYNNLKITEDNYMSDNFSNTYFSLDDCRKIGFIRQDIEDKFNLGYINARERALLITSLLYAMDKIANTCGHYDAYRQGVEFEKHLELYVPQPEPYVNENNVCYNMDTNELAPEIEADLIYIDPPYNSRQYCDAYHLLENVARWEKPEVFGVARKMDRTALKSDYCTQKATVDINILYQKLGHALGTSVTNKEMAQKVIKDERYTRFNKLIDDKFDKNTIIRLLDDFESRNDDEIRSIVTDNADIPTIFEYVLGIAWYIISERKGDVLEYMNLSLEADLLPKQNVFS